MGVELDMFQIHNTRDVQVKIETLTDLQKLNLTEPCIVARSHHIEDEVAVYEQIQSQVWLE